LTRTLKDSLQSEDATKTYIALVDGDGNWNDVNYMEKGWFTMKNPVKDEWDEPTDAETDLCFVTGMTLPPAEGIDTHEGRKVSIVLARPKTGKFHQIRQHLASGRIGHAILGDSSHGRSRTNRIWKKKRHLIKERTCLHLIKVDLPPTEYTPSGISVSSPLAQDLYVMIKAMPGLLEKARPLLLEQGIKI
jgi:23S rRNA-/tRNA-specific pseudouridylate synthase